MPIDKPVPAKRSRSPRKAASETAIAASAAPVPVTTKIGTVADMLRAHGGATLAELVAATGWQPHTTRAALTGLRKKGHAIVKGERDGATAYSIVLA